MELCRTAKMDFTRHIPMMDTQKLKLVSTFDKTTEGISDKIWPIGVIAKIRNGFTLLLQSTAHDILPIYITQVVAIVYQIKHYAIHVFRSIRDMQEFNHKKYSTSWTTLLHRHHVFSLMSFGSSFSQPVHGHSIFINTHGFRVIENCPFLKHLSKQYIHK